MADIRRDFGAGLNLRLESRYGCVHFQSQAFESGNGPLVRDFHLP
jgi:hypothetical protein